LRRGFNLLMAIFVLLLLAGLSMVTLQYAKIKVHHYADTYIKEQAQLFAQSVLEASILHIHGIERRGKCVAPFGFEDPKGRFEANVTVVHYFISDPGASDIDPSDPTCRGKVTRIATPESNGYVVIDIVVRSKPDAFTSPVRIHTRSLQRP